MRLLVLSDIHGRMRSSYELESATAPEKPRSRTSHIALNERSADSRDPLEALRDLMATEDLSCDVVLAPGDIIDRVDIEAFEPLWKELVSIGEIAGAKAVLGTAGNHDVDSRFRHGHHPTHLVSSVIPAFPCVTAAVSNEYWTHGVTEVVVGNCRFLLLNSCATHGKEGEDRHGRVTATMLARARALISVRHEMNILVCHHHPTSIPGIRASVSDAMADGDALLEMLDESAQRWLIVHGHRHVARIWFPGGSSTTPPILAAGSVGASIPPEYSHLASNQLHLIDVTVGTGRLVGSLLGTVRSWSYVPTVGWAPNGLSASLPHVAGFGARYTIDALVEDLASAVADASGPIGEPQILVKFPELRYTEPSTLKKLQVALREQMVDLSCSFGTLQLSRIK